jgi:hypothetical protein
MTLTSRGARALSALGFAAALCACQKQPNFGTLPRLEIPLEKKPAARAPRQTRKVLTTAPVVLPPDAPDPPARLESKQLRLTLGFEEGAVHLVASESVQLAAPVRTPRRLGRFAAELWLGLELLERVRFDFPLLGAGGEAALEPGLSAQTLVEIPELESATQLVIVDRKTGKRLPLPWPPESPATSQPPRAPGSERL